MDEQIIRFCAAADGVRIAYATVGKGPPLIYVCGSPAHLEAEWGKPFIRAFLCEFASGYTFVRYDMRGSGPSDRNVADVSLPAIACDLCGREVASLIPGAQFTALAGASPAGWVHTSVLIPEIHRFLADHESRTGGAWPSGLTGREVEVLRLVAAGRSNREISEELSVSINTVDRHVSNILVKIGASNRAEAASARV
jgi:DNA-binding CsgD family transcriptional regulator